MKPRLQASADGMTQLERLHDSLMRNAEWFRRTGHDGCAFESEAVAARLREAINAMGATHA